ncbi:MAG: GIY-YIG nuclease family protein [Chitinophagaceae bacterium]|nr:GIY-YIG nuclease family protein [Chitinophagaceae bacterium]
MKKNGFVYFLTNKTNKVLYCGVTNELARRTAEHLAKINPGFPERFNCNKLVFYEQFPTMELAIRREKQLKNWKREWKNALISEQNHVWKNLAESIGVDDDLIEAVKEMYKDNRE